MAGDINYSSVVLLLHGDGPDGSTTITDSSGAPKTMTAYAGASISAGQSRFGGSSLSSNNTAGARISTPSHSDFNMGVGDFTVECWVYMVARNPSNLEVFIERRSTTGYYGFSLSIDQGTGCPLFGITNSTPTTFKAQSATALPAGQWVHLAGVKSGSNITLYVNGTSAATAAVSGSNYSTTDPINIFGTSDGDTRFKFNGYLDDVRITKGVARYTANFTPPTEAFPNSATVYALSGNVKNAANANAARVVKVYRESTGALVGSATSDATTGNYSITTPTNDAHTITAYPASGESLPALVLSGVIPV